MTKAKIAIELENKTYKSVIVWGDAYPEYLGEMLNETYNTEAKIKELIELGNICFIDETLSKTIFSNRDNAEKWSDSKPQTYKNAKELKQASKKMDYTYTFQNNNWQQQ